MPTFQEGLSNLGQFMVSPQMPVLAGQLGAGVMAPYAATNPGAAIAANIGNIAANYGKSGIAATEAQAQNAKSAAMNQWLKQLLPGLMAGVQHTPPGVQGPSDTTVKLKGDGTGTMTTNFDAVTQGGNAPAGQGAPAAPQAQAQPPQATQPAPAFNPRLLPF